MWVPSIIMPYLIQLQWTFRDIWWFPRRNGEDTNGRMWWMFRFFSYRYSRFLVLTQFIVTVFCFADCGPSKHLVVSTKKRRLKRRTTWISAQRKMAVEAHKWASMQWGGWEMGALGALQVLPGDTHCVSFLEHLTCMGI